MDQSQNQFLAGHYSRKILTYDIETILSNKIISNVIAVRV